MKMNTKNENCRETFQEYRIYKIMIKALFNKTTGIELATVAVAYSDTSIYSKSLNSIEQCQQIITLVYCAQSDMHTAHL